MTVQKQGARRLQRTAAQKKAAARAAERDLETEEAKRLAQIINLTIAGYSLSDIGRQIGASADEVDRLLQRDMGRYVRNQPALRQYVRNFISAKYTELLESDWEQAKDPDHKDQLEYQDRAIKILDKMAQLHGAKAPEQRELTVDAAPETVDRLVDIIASAQGVGYNANIFDTVPGTVIHEAVESAVYEETVSRNELEAAGTALEDADEPADAL